MEQVYLVWREEANREDGKRVKASCPEMAAKVWAEWADSWGSDYSIVNGTEQRVCVALDEEDSEPEMFDVSGESMPVYHARAVFLKTDQQSREGMIQANQDQVKSIILPAEREKENIGMSHTSPMITAPVRSPSRGKRI